MKASCDDGSSRSHINTATAQVQVQVQHRNQGETEKVYTAPSGGAESLCGCTSEIRITHPVNLQQTVFPNGRRSSVDSGTNQLPFRDEASAGTTQKKIRKTIYDRL